jgi:hypothetical protein
MSVFIGSTSPSQRACLSKEFKKLYAKKTFIPRKQKIAIALNTCDVGIKGVKAEKGYNVYFYHKRNEELESEFVIAKSEKEAIELATKKHRKTYPRQVFSFHKITK